MFDYVQNLEIKWIPEYTDSMFFKTKKGFFRLQYSNTQQPIPNLMENRPLTQIEINRNQLRLRKTVNKWSVGRKTSSLKF